MSLMRSQKIIYRNNVEIIDNLGIYGLHELCLINFEVADLNISKKKLSGFVSPSVLQN